MMRSEVQSAWISTAVPDSEDYDQVIIEHVDDSIRRHHHVPVLAGWLQVVRDWTGVRVSAGTIDGRSDASGEGASSLGVSQVKVLTSVRQVSHR